MHSDIHALIHCLIQKKKCKGAFKISIQIFEIFRKLRTNKPEQKNEARSKNVNVHRRFKKKAVVWTLLIVP